MAQKARADYDYDKIQIDNKLVLVIIDENRDNMSVTNDIENVVEEIAASERIDPLSPLVIYKDSTGIWDGWDHLKKSFISLNTMSKDEAIFKIIHHHENKH